MEGCYNLQPKSLSLILSKFAKYAKRIYLYNMFRHADKNETLDLSFYSGNAEQFELLSFWGVRVKLPSELKVITGQFKLVKTTILNTFINFVVVQHNQSGFAVEWNDQDKVFPNLFATKGQKVPVNYTFNKHDSRWTIRGFVLKDTFFYYPPNLKSRFIIGETMDRIEYGTLTEHNGDLKIDLGSKKKQALFLSLKMGSVMQCRSNYAQFVLCTNIKCIEHKMI